MSKSNYELQLNGLGYNADGTPMNKNNYELQRLCDHLDDLGYNPDGTPMIKTTTVHKTPTYDDLEERVDTFERKLIDEYGIPIDEAEKLITNDLLDIIEMAIDAKFADFLGDLRDFFNPSVETPGIEKGEF